MKIKIAAQTKHNLFINSFNAFICVTCRALAMDIWKIVLSLTRLHLFVQARPDSNSSNQRVYIELLLLTLMPVNVHGWGNNCAYCIIEVRQTAFAPCGNFTIYINWLSYSERLLEVPVHMQYIDSKNSLLCRHPDCSPEYLTHSQQNSTNFQLFYASKQR